MTDAQFTELRAIQLAQLTLLQAMEANLRTITQAAIETIQTARGQQAVQGRTVVNYNWNEAKKLAVDASKVSHIP